MPFNSTQHIIPTNLTLGYAHMRLDTLCVNCHILCQIYVSKPCSKILLSYGNSTLLGRRVTDKNTFDISGLFFLSVLF